MFSIWNCKWLDNLGYFWIIEKSKFWFKPMVAIFYLHYILNSVFFQTIFETTWDKMRQHETTWDNMRQHETTWDNTSHVMVRKIMKFEYRAVCRPLQRPEKTEGVPRSKKGLGAGGSNEPNVTKAFKIVGFQ